MICLHKYGVLLRQIEVADIEKVRVWRNREDVARYMSYRDHITPDMQLDWFRRITSRGDLFFIICDRGLDVGVIDIKNFDEKEGEAEGGIFMASEDLRNSLVPFCAALCVTDFAFEVLRLERLRSHILDSNRRAIRFNKALGYSPTDIVIHGDSRRYYLSRERYLQETRPRFVHLIVSSSQEGVSS